LRSGDKYKILNYYLKLSAQKGGPSEACPPTGENEDPLGFEEKADTLRLVRH